jgi:hypothetical protein
MGDECEIVSRENRKIGKLLQGMGKIVWTGNGGVGAGFEPEITVNVEWRKHPLRM